MTITSLVFGTFISEIFFVLTKVIFLHYLNIDNLVVRLVFFVALILITTAIVRRMGVMNYIECFFLGILWIVVLLIVDIAVTATLIGREMYGHLYYWLTYVAIIASLILFHKALHVQVRKANVKK